MARTNIKYMRDIFMFTSVRTQYTSYQRTGVVCIDEHHYNVDHYYYYLQFEIIFSSLYSS